MDVMSAFRNLYYNVFFVFTFVCCLLTVPTDGLKCYVCSYSYTGVKEATYKCVSEPWNVTTGYQRLNSFDRFCGNPESYNCGRNCCDSSLQNEGCQYECHTDLCNNNTKVITPSGSGDPKSRTGSVKSDKISFVVISVLHVLLISFLI
ncbi:hypothetical protein KUTeg_015641 [Tegillarca granosa]|uniref:Uncharacterized protein n=1 Tax=Tegillarca granosa TaxID=220873 RepID=A0ABQ9EVE5_TEGGR|nr:hypothetical protein KUTeg_015641 [Tegillarca granosa]